MKPKKRLLRNATDAFCLQWKAYEFGKHGIDTIRPKPAGTGTLAECFQFLLG
jgi:hypothetical protein